MILTLSLHEVEEVSRFFSIIIFQHFPIFSKSRFPISDLVLILNFLFPFLFLFDSSLPIDIMRVHPLPKKRNMANRDAMDGEETLSGGCGGVHKRLRRLPHVFSRVLELPFPSDADVSVEESSDSFRFVAVTDDDAVIGDGVRVHAVEVHPGVTKIVVRNGGDVRKFLPQ